MLSAPMSVLTKAWLKRLGASRGFTWVKPTAVKLEWLRSRYQLSPQPAAAQATVTSNTHQALVRMTRQASAPDMVEPAIGCAGPIGIASGVAPTGRGRRIGVVVGNVVISTPVEAGS